MSVSSSLPARRLAAVAAERDASRDRSLSPVGSPSRSVLSRLSYSTSPKTKAYPRSSNAAIMTPSELALQAQAEPIRPSPSSSPSKASSDPLTHPFTHGLEQAGENVPYYLGTKDVTLADKYLRDDGCHRLVHELLGRQSGMEVVTMDLRGNDIRRYGAEALGELMRENTTVETLNLEWNFLGDSGGSGLEALCDALKTNRTLKTLDLRNNRLNSECGAALARLLIANHTLQHLDLRWNNLSVNGGLALADALIRNHYIRTIALSGNRIPSQTIRAIEEALAKNRQVAMQAGGKKDKDEQKDPNYRIIELEQQVHDLHRELEHLQSRSHRQDLELQSESKRCDELTNDLASLKDHQEEQKAQWAKNLTECKLDLEKAQQSLHEQHRLHDLSEVALKQSQLDLIKTSSELRMVTEDRSRLLLAREASHALLNAQLEKLHSELARSQEASHQRERAFAEERDAWAKKAEGERRIQEQEKELAVQRGEEKIRALQLELNRAKDEHSLRDSEVHSRLKSLGESAAQSANLVLQLREQLVAQGIAHEEALSKSESSAAAKEAKAHEKILKEFESRLAAVQASRDDASRQARVQAEQYATLLAQVTAERQAHLAAIEAERQRSGGQDAQSELFTLRRRLLELEHKYALAKAKGDAEDQTKEAAERRHQEQIDAIYSKANAETLSAQKALRRSEEERARLMQMVKHLEGKLAGMEAEQYARSANLASALSVLKSSISVVDENVNSTMRHGRVGSTVTSSGDDRDHHPRRSHSSSHRDDRGHSHSSRDRRSDRESRHTSASHAHHRDSHRSDRDREREREPRERRSQGSGDQEESELTPRQHRGSAPGSPSSRQASRPSSSSQRRDHLVAPGAHQQRSGETVAASGSRPQMQQLPLSSIHHPVSRSVPVQQVTPTQIPQQMQHEEHESADASLSYEEDARSSETPAEVSF
jgi:hypothetical protein